MKRIEGEGGREKEGEEFWKRGGINTPFSRRECEDDKKSRKGRSGNERERRRNKEGKEKGKK